MEQVHLRPGLKFIITVLPSGTAAEKKIQGSADGNNFQRRRPTVTMSEGRLVVRFNVYGEGSLVIFHSFWLFSI